MAGLLELHCIEEFRRVKQVPAEAITPTIISNVRGLYEKEEIEPFIREILYDPTKTPHGPTEKADILTHHVHVGNEARLAGFVLKGKSFKNVSNKDVAHQFDKVRAIPDISLMVFLAVGHIQDDARTNFAQTAKDADCDYLIIDARDCAQLFIAYQKICPKDGTPYNEIGVCKRGHEIDPGIPLLYYAAEKPRYDIVSLSDVSHAGAKRYKAFVILDRHYTTPVIRDIIREATETVKQSGYYRDERVRAHWGDTPAHVVWLFIAADQQDIRACNWICRTSWIDASLPRNMRPSALSSDEQIDHIEIAWHEGYEEQRQLLESKSAPKGEYLRVVQPIIREMVQFGQRAKQIFERYQAGKISEPDLISQIQNMEPRVTELYHLSGNIAFPPEDCKDYDQACQNVFATVDNMFLYHSQRGLETWPRKNRDWLLASSLEDFDTDVKAMKFEEDRLH